MNPLHYANWYNRLMSDYGMIVILVGLCVLFSFLTITEQHPAGAAAAEDVLEQVRSEVPAESHIVVITSTGDSDAEFAKALNSDKAFMSRYTCTFISGSPSDIRLKLEQLDSANTDVQFLATTHEFSPTVKMISARLPRFESTAMLTPSSHRWPTFLTPDNIRNVANQITVIAIIAIGMTLVIITAGIDLSVGSIIALSAVVVAWIIGQLGGEGASTATMVLAAVGSILICGGVGAFSGLMITGFRIPPFIATLAMMQVAAGLGYIISQGKPIIYLAAK